jgi:membrane protein implicated in regulation of membrane protease activity
VSRLRSFLAAAGVAAAVFTYLSLPILREWYGPAVDLVVYAGIALVAGGVTYAVVRGVSREDDRTTGQRAYDEEMAAVEEESEAIETDEEIEEIIREME